MKIKFTLIGLFLLISATIFADGVTIEAARKVAQNLYFEKTGIKQAEIVFGEEITVKEDNTAMYYVFNMKEDNGFVLVAADDVVRPIIGYSTSGTFNTQNQPSNLAGWLQHYEDEIIYLNQNNVEANQTATIEWTKYNADSKSFIPNKSAKGVAPLVDHIKWNQDYPWNQFCPEDAEGPGGHVYAGCVATAMSIVMKYWNYPNKGTGTHTYNASPYGNLTANFGTTNYFFGYMDDNTANEYSSLLMYHCGIAVDMGYAGDGSGAFSQDVPSVLTSYFGYSNSSFKNKSSYSASTWNGYLKTEFDAARPVYYSGRDVNNGGHAFVCSGYDETVADDYFHFNFGWGGSSNGFYYINNSTDYEFYYGQACITGIKPSTIYPEAPATMDAELSQTTLYDVDITWAAPATKGLLSYTIYRDDVEIATNVPTSQTIYTDVNVPIGVYHYGVQAVYSTGKSILSADMIEVKDKFKVIFELKQPNGQVIYPGKVTFNGVQKPVSFLGTATFNDVNFGDNQSYSALETSNNYSYADISGEVKIYKDQTFSIVFLANDINDLNSNVSIYPNPTNGLFNVETTNEILKIEIYNVSGQLIYEAKNVNIIDITNKTSGLYFVNIVTKNGSVIEKLIKN